MEKWKWKKEIGETLDWALMGRLFDWVLRAADEEKQHEWKTTRKLKNDIKTEKRQENKNNGKGEKRK